MPEALIEIEREDGAVDALVTLPDAPAQSPPVILLGDGRASPIDLQVQARRLSAHRFLVLTPDLRGLRAEARREAAVACLDHLADLRGVDDTRVGVVGIGAGADVALSLAAWRAERIAAVAAYAPSGFGARTSLEIASRINGIVRLGYVLGVVPRYAGILETAFTRAGVLFDIEIGDGQPDWGALIDLLDRTLWAPAVLSGHAVTASSAANGRSLNR